MKLFKIMPLIMALGVGFVSRGMFDAQWRRE